MSIDTPNAERGWINKLWFKKFLFSFFSSFLSTTTTRVPSFSLSLIFFARMVSKRLYIWGGFHLL